ncbi:MAG: argininosuccinate synthase [Gammaproteobacteria bacterium]|nr:argininosuccinate synthase [Gammaproteobacteria bacterium]
MNKIVLAYSGGLDTSIAIKWLKEKYHYDVIAVSIDVGENKDWLAIKQKAYDIGAVQCHVIDAKQIFAEQFLGLALQNNALYEGVYPLISALSRPLIAKILVDIAHQEQAVAVAHGCTGKGNDQVRFDVSISVLDPTLKIIAPVREAPLAREEAILYAKKHNIPLPIDLENPFSIDQNLWGRSCECGVLEDPWCEPPEAAFEWTKPIEAITTAPTEITLDFVKGLPVALNNERLPLHQLIAKLNILAGEQGVGRIDHIENRLIGIKSREVYEAPAAMTLIKAHQALEALTLPREVMHFKPFIEQKMTNLIYEGLWYSPLRAALVAFTEQTQSTVTGTVRLKLSKGNINVVGRKSDHSLYNLALATYAAEDAFDHQAALGFIKLWGLPLQVFSQVNSKLLSKPILEEER